MVTDDSTYLMELAGADDGTIMWLKNSFGWALVNECVDILFELEGEDRLEAAKRWAIGVKQLRESGGASRQAILGVARQAVNSTRRYDRENTRFAGKESGDFDFS